MSLHSLDAAAWDAAIEQFTGEVIHAYQMSDQYGTDKCIFAAKSVGETWNYPVVENSVAVNAADGPDSSGNDIVNASNTGYQTNDDDIRTPELTVDRPIKDIRYLPLDQLEVRPDLKLPDNYAKMLGRAVGEGKGIRLTGLLANAANDATGGIENVNTVDVTSDDDDTIGALLKHVFNVIGGDMDLGGVPSDGRHAMLKSNWWYTLLGIDGIFTKEFGGQSNVQRPGEVIMYANFMIHNGRNGFGLNTSNTEWAARMSAETHYQYDMTALMAVVWHTEAWALRHWKEPQVMNDWSTDYDAFKLEARLTMGATAIQGNQGCYSIEEA